MSASPDNIDYNRTANVSRLHAAAAREKGEHTISNTPVSLWIVLGVTLLALTAGAFFAGNVGSDWSIANRKGYVYTAEMPAGVGTVAGEMDPLEKRQPANWINAGKAVYSNCVACHQPTGLGMAGQFPHLKGSEFVIHGEKRLAAILLRGMSGPCVVDGKSFNGNMQSWNASLTPPQIAQVISYIRNEWGNVASVVYEDQIIEAKKLVGPLGTQLTEAELRAIPQDENLPPSTWVEKLKAGATAGGSAPGGAAPAPAAGVAAPPVK